MDRFFSGTTSTFLTVMKLKTHHQKIDFSSAPTGWLIRFTNNLRKVKVLPFFEKRFQNKMTPKNVTQRKKEVRRGLHLGFEELHFLSSELLTHINSSFLPDSETTPVEISERHFNFSIFVANFLNSGGEK